MTECYTPEELMKEGREGGPIWIDLETMLGKNSSCKIKLQEVIYINYQYVLFIYEYVF